MDDITKQLITAKTFKTTKAGAPKADINKIAKDIKRDSKTTARTNKGLIDEVLKENQSSTHILTTKLEDMTKSIATNVTETIADTIAGQIEKSFETLTAALVKALQPNQPQGSKPSSNQPPQVQSLIPHDQTNRHSDQPRQPTSQHLTTQSENLPSSQVESTSSNPTPHTHQLLY